MSTYETDRRDTQVSKRLTGIMQLIAQPHTSCCNNKVLIWLLLTAVFTSGTNIGGDQDLLLAVPEAVDHRSPLLHLHFSAEQRHLVALFGQLSCQPTCSLPCLGQAVKSTLSAPSSSSMTCFAIETIMCSFFRYYNSRLPQ